MMQPKRDFWSYFTAFWEGEGYLTLHKRSVILGVVQKVKKPLNYIKSHLKVGKIRNNRKVWLWKVTRRLDVIRIVEQMLPFAVFRDRELKRKLEILKSWEKNYPTVGWTDEEKKILRQKWMSLTDEQLAHLFPRHSAEAVLNKRVSLGLLRMRKSPNYTAKEIDLIKGNYQCLTDREISMQIGRGARAVQSKRKKLGFKKEKGLKGLKGSKPKFTFEEKTLRDLYLKQKLSSWKIAQLLGCSSSLIRQWLEKYGIPRRNSSDQCQLRNRDWKGRFA